LQAFDYVKPNSLEEASALLIAGQPQAHVLAGGTDLLLRVGQGRVHPALVVDIKGLPGLTDLFFAADLGLHLGAGLTLGQIAGHSEVRRRFPLLAETCSWMGSAQIRNRATLGGHIVGCAPNADAVAVLLCYDARCQVYGPAGWRILDLHSFYTPAGPDLAAGELLTAVILPPPPPDLAAVYHKLRQGQGGRLTLAGVAASATCAAAPRWRVALTAAGPYPQRCLAAETLLASARPERLTAAADTAMAQADPPADGRGGVAYRRAMIGVLLHRAAAALDARLGGCA